MTVGRDDAFIFIDIDMDGESDEGLQTAPLIDVTKSPDAAKEPPRLNIAQRFAGGMVSFMETTAALVAGTGVIVDEDVPLLPVPGDYAVTTIAAIGAKEALQSLRVLARREHPLDYLFLEGGGSFVKGLAKEVGKKAAAAIPPVLFAIAASYGREKLFDYAMANAEENPNLLLALFYLDTPIMRSLLIGVPALLMYFAGQKIIERVVPGMQPPEMPPIDDEDTRWYQKVLDEGLLLINGMTMAGMGRQIFNTLGPAIFLHSPYSLLMGPVAILFVLPLLHYVGEELHPFQSVQDFFAALDGKPVTATVLDDANPPAEEEGPSNARIAANIATKLAIALGVFALAALVNRYTSVAMSKLHDNGDGDFQNDPSGWTTAERLGYEAALLAGVILVQRMLENLPAAIEKVKEHGPEVVQNIKKGVPMVAKNIKDSVVSAAEATAHGVTRAAKTAADLLRPSLQGLFASKQPARPIDGNKIQMLGGSLPRIDVDELDFDFPDDENVTEGLSF